MSDELKPCPFCGSSNFYSEKIEFDARVGCGNCGAKTRLYNTDEEAIEAWNKRAQPEFTLDELDAIRRMFECRYPRPQQLSAFETTIINKCKAALKGECE